MANFQPNLKSIACIGLISLSTLAPTLSRAESDLSGSSLSNQLPLEWELYIPSDELGSPDNREGGTTRGPDTLDSCMANPDELTALVPASGEAKTIQAYPTFFWYLPETTAQKVEFRLKDDRDIEVYKTQYLLANLPHSDSDGRIMHLQLPFLAGMQPLEIGKEYHWELSVICDANVEIAEDDIVTTAKITRVAPDASLSDRLEKLSEEEKVIAYAKKRLWHETLISLHELRKLRPDDLNLIAAWTKLLRSAGLQEIAQKSLSSETIVDK